MVTGGCPTLCLLSILTLYPLERSHYSGKKSFVLLLESGFSSLEIFNLSQFVSAETINCPRRLLRSRAPSVRTNCFVTGRPTRCSNPIWVPSSSVHSSEDSCALMGHRLSSVRFPKFPRGGVLQVVHSSAEGCDAHQHILSDFEGGEHLNWSVYYCCWPKSKKGRDSVCGDDQRFIRSCVSPCYGNTPRKRG